MPAQVLHGSEFGLNLEPVSPWRFDQMLKNREILPVFAQPDPQQLPTLAKILFLPPLYEIEDRAVVVFIPEGIVNVMAIGIPADRDLVIAAAHDDFTLAAVPLVDRIAERGRVFMQLDVALEAFQLGPLVHEGTLRF